MIQGKHVGRGFGALPPEETVSEVKTLNDWFWILAVVNSVVNSVKVASDSIFLHSEARSDSRTENPPISPIFDSQLALIVIRAVVDNINDALSTMEWYPRRNFGSSARCL